MQVIILAKIGELALRNSELETLEVVQELGQHTTCRIEFTRDRAQVTKLEDLLQQPVTVTVQGEMMDPIEIFQGRIADGTQRHLLHFGSSFVLHGVSPSVRHDYRDTTYYPQATLASITGKLGAKVDGQPRKSPPPHDFVQWSESEMDFLRRVADEHGGFLVTTGPAVEVRSEFKSKGWRLVWGETLLELAVCARPVNHGYTGASYDPKDKSTHVHNRVRVAAPGLGGAARLVTVVEQLAAKWAGGGDPLVAEPMGRAWSHADFKDHLRQESERALGSAVVVDGVSGMPGLLAGDEIELVQGTDFELPTTGKFGLVRVVHDFREQHYTNKFVATPWKNFFGFAPPARPEMEGLVTAEVVDVADPEKLCRVKVKYRWQTDTPTNWARLLTPHAGNGRGIMFVPEIGDEVIVAFEHGDPERPYVLGSLWNGKDKPPENDDQNNAKRIITRSGNTIQLLDNESEETIEIHTPEGKCLLQLTNKGGNPIVTVHSEGDIVLDAKQEIRLKSKTFVQEVESDSKRKVGGEDVVDAGKNVTLKAGADAILNGGMNAVVKGGMNVESVAGAVNNVVGTLVHIQPPGFMAKPIMVPQIRVQSEDLGERATPEKAEPARTADPVAPRT